MFFSQLCRKSFGRLVGVINKQGNIATCSSIRKSTFNGQFCRHSYQLQQNVEWYTNIRQSRTILTSSFQLTGSVTKVDENADGDLTLDWEDGVNDVFPYVYLRDNCSCASCFDRNCKTRLDPCYDINIKPKSKLLTGDGKTLEITWPDGHNSKYDSDWLLANSFRPEIQKEREREMMLEPPRNRLWGHEMEKNITKMSFDQIIKDDQTLHDFLWHMSTTGLVIVEKTPLEKGQVKTITERIAFPRMIYYGLYFDVCTKADPSSFAYLPNALPLHNDQVYLEDNPGIQLLHCIKQVPGEGGANPLVDGFNVVKHLAEEDPEAYRILTTNRFTTPDRGCEPDVVGDFFYASNLPAIELCQVTGELKRIRVNCSARDFRFVPLKDVKPVYRAFAKMHEMLYDPRFLIHYKLKEGDMLVIDNRRLLHGRTAFKSEPQKPGDISRLLEGTYVEWDDVMSRLRMLRKNLGIAPTSHLNYY